jgi:PBP1b-binding outer membrane lipoprotein LpoB
MNLYRYYFHILIAAIVLVSCTSTKVSTKSQPHPTQVTASPKTVTLDQNFPVAMGQTIYVPVYSHIYHHNRQEIFNLAVTLSIRNTDLTNSIMITAVRYYDSNGKLLKQYLQQPIQLDALASTDFFVNRNDMSGGLGANFLVEWISSTTVAEPVVEAVMIGSDFQQGISFISPGRVIKRQTLKQVGREQ